MTYAGKIINGVVVLEANVKLPEGTFVRVEPLEERPLLDLLLATEQAPPNPDWPEDGAAELDHYLYGTAKHEQ
jgi:hypothetical protein